MEQLHQHSENRETRQYDYCRIAFYPCLKLRSHESQVFCPLDQKEVNNSSGADASEYPYLPFQIAPVIEGEYHAGYKLHHCSEEKGYRHRQEYPENHRQGFLRVKQIIKTETDASRHLDQCHDKCRA